ncbi:MAG: FG-GAP repeat domain-containing protein [Planctomycetota bacterium JB042]
MTPVRSFPLLVPFLIAATSSRDGEAETVRLPVEGRATAVRFADVDGDGDRDALVSTSRADGGAFARGVALFLRTARGGRFEAAPSARLDVGGDALFVDAADLDGDGREELLVLDVAGLSRHRYRDGRFAEGERVVDVPSFFRATAGPELPFVDLAKDLDGDRRDDLLIPGRDGYVFLRATDDGLDGPHALVSESSHRLSSGPNEAFRVKSRLARPTPVDWDGRGGGDLMLAFEGQLVRVALGRSGPPAAPEVLLDLTSLEDGGKAGEDGLVTHDGRLRDIDGDGRCDLLFARRVARPGLVNAATTRNVLFLADDLARGRVPKPRQVIRTDGLTSPPRLFDLDGDGALELVVTTVRTDVLSKLRESMLSAARVTFDVFRFEPERRRFSDAPVFSTTLAVPADALLEVGAYGWVTFKADYDGDGRPDLATYHAGEGRLRVRKGEEERGFFSSTPISYADEPFFETSVALEAPFFAEDVDGDGPHEAVAVNGDHVLIVRVGGRR